MTDTVRLVLADDHEVTRTGFVSLLAGHPEFEVVGQAADGQQAIDLCQELQPDIAILDIRMPVLNGLGAARILQQRMPDLKVVIFTMDDSTDHLEAAISAGAVGYLLKDASRDEVIAGLQRVARGEEALNSTVSARLLRRMTERNTSGAANPSHLTNVRYWDWWRAASAIVKSAKNSVLLPAPPRHTWKRSSANWVPRTVLRPPCVAWRWAW
ncbi:hypothetical protein ALO73_200046 [Pseudomonas syringae pv. daphniphylli]|uniref:Response regulatory domain-containing protein n=1 Tax=Pseudomonas syringae pv. daphniphylli TaxID=264455 RepID=A0A9X0KT77_PSESX|nr:hypothetical protein ALO73_200046 [Pseudomonas syringae pv. daphniphylli]